MALYYNPAGIGFAKGSQLGLYGTLVLRHASWDHAEPANDPTPDPADAKGANTGTASLTNVFGGPALGGTLRVGNILTLGAGFFAPFGGSSHWGKNDEFSGSTKYPLAAGGVQRWFAIDGLVRVLYFTAGAALRLGPLSIGATGNFISSTIDTTQAKQPGGANLPITTMEGRAFLDAHAFNGSIGAGVMLEAVPDQLWIGASYQSQPGFGQQKLTGQFNVTSLSFGNLPDKQIDFLQTLPDIWRGGVRWKPKNAPLEFRVFGDRTNWSKFTSQCVVLQGNPCNIGGDGTEAGGTTNVQAYLRRDWVDTYGGRLGISWWVVPEVEMLFGGGYETAATPDSTLAPDLFDANNFQATLGARFRLTESLFLTASYTHIQYLTRDNTNKSTLAVFANGQPVGYPTVEEDSGGVYKQWIGFMTGNLEGIF
jgi:long-chain fatty acid transport protein